MSCSLLGTYCAQELTGIRGGGQSSLWRQLEACSEDRSCGAGSRPRLPRAPWVSGAGTVIDSEVELLWAGGH